MSESNPNCKRDAEEFEACNGATVSPLKKKKKLDDDSSSPDSHGVGVGVVIAVPSPSVASSADSVPGGYYSVTSTAEDDDDKSSIISSGCFSSESNEIVKNNPNSVVDLKNHQISETETETSTSITSNFRKEENPVSETTETESSSATEKDKQKKPKEVIKQPTPEEIEEFFSKFESEEDQQKQFIEKYNFDIVNDKPLEGRYKWDRLNP